MNECGVLWRGEDSLDGKAVRVVEGQKCQKSRHSRPFLLEDGNEGWEGSRITACDTVLAKKKK